MADRGRARGLGYGLVTVGLALALLGLVEVDGAAPAEAQGSLPPRAESGDGHVTADPLPTVQVNGVVWDQEIIGNTVYAVGDFTAARPAGTAPGQNQTPRSHILAYNLETGALISSFAPSVNRQIKTVTASPDGSRIYIGGEFTSVNGVNRFRIAALDPTTGALITGFNAIVDFRVNALVATDTTLYAGGAFNFAGSGASTPRSRLAAFSASNGALLTWAPSANNTVHAMVLSPDGSKLFVGGQFDTINGAGAYGLGAINAGTGALMPWAVNQTIRLARDRAAILTLESDGASIYGGGFTWGRNDGNFEGIFSADPDTGAINWLQDCHGDSYSTASANGYVYVASHDHYCGNLDGFPQSENWGDNQRHALSFTTEATGVLRRDPWGYHNWEGYPSPSPVHWYPEWEIGTYTGQNQATWSLAANDEYLVAGGEFLRVNNVPQQGLVRFAVKPIAPADNGPRLGGSDFPINVRSTAAGRARISFPANYDRDDQELEYRITRDGVDVHTTRADSTYWDQPVVGFTDTGLTPGQSYTYRVWVSDDDGNTAVSNPTSVTVATSGSPSSYADTVMADGARIHWRLGESGGSSTRDELGFKNATVGNVSLGASGAILGDSNTAATFSNSSTSRIYSTSRTWTEDTLSVEAWVRTPSSAGGRIVGYGNNTTSSSTNYDRLLYMTNDGRVVFGARPRTEGPGPSAASVRRTVQSQPGLNNNQWHHVVGTLGSDGMHLYVDGVRVASRGDTMGGQAFYGSWKIGADTLSGWPNRPSSDTFSGQIDEVAIYHKVLTPAQVAGHYSASGRTPSLPPPPADAYGAAVRGLDPYLYYRLAELLGTAAGDSGIRANTGDYVGSTTRNQQGIVGGNPAVQFTGSGFVASRTGIYSPQRYSLETWFKTTSTTGGKLIGFGNSRTGNSAVSDRHVYLRNDGRLVFGVREGDANRIVTPGSYNDGEWHHVVATQGDDGMTLYVDGAVTGTNPQKVARSYTGFWRIGGDTTPADATSNGFSGTIDEPAVYDRVLTPAQVTQHLELGGGEVANVPPTASFTHETSGLDLTVDGSGSNDPDGTIESYEWDFGDGTTATGANADHTYAAGGDYTVTLTVTDDDGDTDDTSTQVTVEGQVIVASDAFERQVANGFGQADVGGAYSLSGSAANFAVDGGQGRITVPAAGNSRAATLSGVGLADADVGVDLALDKPPTGGGAWMSVAARKVGSTEYRLRLRVQPTATHLQLQRVVNGAETLLASQTVPGVVYTPDSVVHLRLTTTGSGTTALAGKVWFDDQSEPTDWQIQATDDTAVLQQAGGVGTHIYVSGSTTNAPVVMVVDNLVARTVPQN